MGAMSDASSTRVRTWLDDGNRYAALQLGRRSQWTAPSSKHPETSQQQQHGGDGDGLIDEIGRLAGVIRPVVLRRQRGGCGLRGGLHRGPAFLCLTASVTEA